MLLSIFEIENNHSLWTKLKSGAIPLNKLNDSDYNGNNIKHTPPKFKFIQ